MKTFVAISLMLLSLFIYAGPLPPNDLSGETLRTWLQDNWHKGKHNDLGYNEARRAMYSFIDVGTDGMVTGVYTGFKQASKDTTFLNPINAEHTIPQSWFNRKPPMKSDLHHLFPTHKDVNSARSNSPFGEIDDDATEKWYIASGAGLKKITHIPATEIDSYSESRGGKIFEPREDHKGNLARAAYYFYTMYPDSAGDITKLANKDVLFQWHLDDPVDDAEKIRNDRIEQKQGNRNPYIDHPEIVARAWGHENTAGTVPDPDITDNINSLKTEIANMETALAKLKAELARLQNNLTD